MTQKYLVKKVIPHLFALRVAVLGPLTIAVYLAGFVYVILDHVTKRISYLLPAAYLEEAVEFDQLPPCFQKSFKELDREPK